MGSWESVSATGLTWERPIDHVEAKRSVAAQMAERLRPGDVVGVGSGSTAFLTVQALARRAAGEGLQWAAVPTSAEVELACGALGVPTTSLLVARPDWAFDGADEVDARQRLIKGRGGALLREKLVLASARERYIVVDESKLVDQLGSKFPVPVEVVPDATSLVLATLAAWPRVRDCRLRPAGGKDGAVVTERGNVLIDVHFDGIDDGDEQRLNAVPGIVECGLFVGYDPQVVVAR
jgi:ribose 5-phosphate isomerase A